MAAENLADAKEKMNKSFTEASRAMTAKGPPKGHPKGSAKGSSENGAASGPSNKGGKGNKKGHDATGADGRRVRSPEKRPKGTAGNDYYQHRSRSPRSGTKQYSSWENKW